MGERHILFKILDLGVHIYLRQASKEKRRIGLFVV
jgi:hypothetical protein